MKFLVVMGVMFSYSSIFMVPQPLTSMMAHLFGLPISTGSVYITPSWSGPWTELTRGDDDMRTINTIPDRIIDNDTGGLNITLDMGPKPISLFHSPDDWRLPVS